MILMQSLQTPTSTHFRAGNDYIPQNADSQWRIGVTSILLWSLGLFPDKDTFYSTTTEVTMNPQAPFYNYTELYPHTHAIVSSLSAGPITPSDAVDGSNATLIMMICREDGMLLKPDRPAMNIEATFLSRAFSLPGPQSEVWNTFTIINDNIWYYVFGCQLSSPYNFQSNDFVIPPLSSNQFVYYQYNLTNAKNINLNTFNSITIPSGSTPGDSYLYIVAPIFANSGWVFLGEVNKFIAISKQRFLQVTDEPLGVTLQISGSNGENVLLAFLQPNTTLPVFWECLIPSSGIAQFDTKTQKCIQI